jgi:hypothetical protein
MQNSLTEGPAPAALGAAEPTVASTWLAASQRPADDGLLDWPPDVFAFADVILDRAEAYRFVVSPPAGRAWPPTDAQGWRRRVRAAARGWCARADDRSGTPPRLVIREWLVVQTALDTPLRDIASGRAWRVCQGLLTLHTVADEACAAVAAGDLARGGAIVLRARASELLARTGTVARINPALLCVVPKYHTPAGGIKPRSISRHISRTGPAASLSVGKVAEASDRSSLSPADLTVLLSWSEAVAQALATSPRSVPAVVANARAGASWRTEFGVRQPPAALADALDGLGDYPARRRAI